MNVPVPTPYAQIPPGGVFMLDAQTWLMVQNATTAVNLATGVAVTINNQGETYPYFPSARLSFG